MDLQVEVTAVQDVAALAAVTAEWEDLAAHAVEPNPAYEPWMLLPALEGLAAAQPVRVVLARCGKELAGLFPLQLERRYRGLPVRTLASWRHPHFMLGAPLVRAGRAPQVLAALLRWVREEASLLELSHVAAEGPFCQALVDVLNEGDYAFAAAEPYTRPLLCKDLDAESYLRSSLSGEQRRDLRRKEKRLAEAGRLEHVVLRSKQDLGRWIDEFLALEASGWKGRRGSALACSEANRRFAVQVYTGAFERGRLMMVGLDLDGRPIARNSGFVSGEGAIAFKTAYDETLRKYGPGIFAEVDMIREFHGRPALRWMDSYTAPNNVFIAALWKHRRIVQRVAVAADARGELALAALPALRWAKRALGRCARRPSAVRTIPSLHPA